MKKIWNNKTWPKVALATEPTPRNVFEAAPVRRRGFHADKWNLIFNTDVEEALTLLSDAKLKVDCIVTSPLPAKIGETLYSSEISVQGGEMNH